MAGSLPPRGTRELECPGAPSIHLMGAEATEAGPLGMRGQPRARDMSEQFMLAGCFHVPSDTGWVRHPVEGLVEKALGQMPPV